MTHWRFYSTLSFVAQILRIPLAMMLADSSETLAAYFIVTAAAIPAQFIAAEFVQYHGFGVSKPRANELVCIAVVVITAAYMFIAQGALLCGVYSVFCVSLVVGAVGGFSLRTYQGARQYLGWDAALNVAITVGVLLMLSFAETSEVALFMLMITALLNLIFGFIAMRVAGFGRLLLPSAVPLAVAGTSFALQVCILISTQLERLFIGAVWPAFLGVIAIAAAATQAWRRIVLDDSILFERIRNSNTVGSVALDHISLYTKFAAPFIVVLLMGAFAGIHFAGRLAGYALPPAFGWREINAVAALLGLYLAALPAGIVAVNILRDGRTRFSWRPFVYLSLVAAFELAMLLLSHIRGLPRQSVWMMVAVTAAVNFAIILDFLYARKIPASRSVKFGVFSYLIVSSLIVWGNA